MAGENRSRYRRAREKGIRWIVLLLFASALAVAGLAGVPTKTGGGQGGIPAVALGQPAIYRLEIFLLVFYSGLLVATPLYRAVVDGHLPVEVSARGARFADDAKSSLAQTREFVDDLERRLEISESIVSRTQLNIDQLAEETHTSLRD